MMSDHKSKPPTPSKALRKGNRKASPLRATKLSLPLYVEKQLIQDIEFAYPKGLFSEDFKLLDILNRKPDIYGTSASVSLIVI